MDIYRDRPGATWAERSADCIRGLICLAPATQDEDTGRWRFADGEHITVTEAVLAADYAKVPPEPLRDPRITHLGHLVEQLLTEYQDTTGRPAPAAEEIRAAILEVRAIPEEWSRRRHAAVRNARSAAYRRG